MPALWFPMKTTGKDILKQQKTQPRGKCHRELCQNKPCRRSGSCPRPEIISCSKKRDLSGTEECDKGRRRCWDGVFPPGTSSSFKMIYLNQNCSWQPGRSKGFHLPNQDVKRHWIIAPKPRSSHPELLCGTFTVLRPPVRTQQKSVPQLKSIERHLMGLFQPPLPWMKWVCSITVPNSAPYFMNHWKTDPSRNICMPVDN